MTGAMSLAAYQWPSHDPPGIGLGPTEEVALPVLALGPWCVPELFGQAELDFDATAARAFRDIDEEEWIPASEESIARLKTGPSDIDLRGLVGPVALSRVIDEIDKAEALDPRLADAAVWVGRGSAATLLDEMKTLGSFAPSFFGASACFIAGHRVFFG